MGKHDAHPDTLLAQLVGLTGKKKQTFISLTGRNTHAIVFISHHSTRIPPVTMTETNQRASGQGDARKSPTSVTKRSRSLGVLGYVACALLYGALTVAVGFSAFQLQTAAKGIQFTGAKLEANARKSADMSTKMDHLVLQVSTEITCSNEKRRLRGI